MPSTNFQSYIAKWAPIDTTEGWKYIKQVKFRGASWGDAISRCDSFMRSREYAKTLDPTADLDYIPMGDRPFLSWKGKRTIKCPQRGYLRWVSKQQPKTPREVQKMYFFVCRGNVGSSVKDVVEAPEMKHAKELGMWDRELADGDCDPHDRLRAILDTFKSEEDGENEEIDQLYVTVLEAALGNRRLRKVERESMQQVLHTVVCARDPLTVSGLSELLQIRNADRVRAVLRPLWSVLHIVGANELVTTLHASFPDFMFDPSRSKAYHCSPEAHNRILAEHCLERISRTQPQFNICGLESSYLPDDMVSDIQERVAGAISSDLLYACRYWADHVEAGKCASALTVQLQDLLSTRLLLWMEVLNLNKLMRTGVECMKRAVEWCNRSESDEELMVLANDAQRFVDIFAANPVSQSTPHIYVSMLAFWPSSSPIAKHYLQFTHGPVKAEGTALDQRQLAHLATWVFEGAIYAMTLSPDGRYLALVIGRDVLVVESSSGQLVLGPLDGHSEYISKIMFSPDCTRVVAASLDYTSKTATIIGWDTRTGDIVVGPLPLDGLTSSISCLTFWPDCTCIASSFDEQTIRLWDATTGKMLRSLETNTSVRVVAFSSDGMLMAAGFGQALQVWNSQTGETTLGPLSTGRVDMITFSHNSSRIIHTAWFNDTISVRDAQDGQLIHELDVGIQSDVISYVIGYSSDDRHIALGHQGAVYVWDVQNGKMMLGPLEVYTISKFITSIVFSPDGSRIISACSGGIVCTWDARQHSFAPKSIDTCPSGISLAKFSPDGQHFVSASRDGSLHIWGSYTGAITVGPIKAHVDLSTDLNFLNDGVVAASCSGDTVVFCDARSGEVLRPLKFPGHQIHHIAFSPKGALIATGSRLDSSSEVNLWDAQTGTRLLDPLTGFRYEITSVQFSPDGTRILATSSDDDKQIVVWGVADGRNLFDFLNGHTNTVFSASYSPDGALIASGSDDKTIIVWDAYTGCKLLGPLVGHSSWVHSVQFSPDSTRLVSGSWDTTIRIWDVRTGDMLFELLHGHKQPITSVAYSPDGTRILSCSVDGGVRIHDAQSAKDRALLHSTPDFGDWVMNKDGWIVDDQSRLLVWVPADLRRALMLPRTQVAVAAWGYGGGWDRM
ncbi:vegetative incompatibility protein HET-E-1, putative, partial [Rhizoctonia solani AG-3 Rhs1AP]